MGRAPRSLALERQRRQIPSLIFRHGPSGESPVPASGFGRINLGRERIFNRVRLVSLPTRRDFVGAEDATGGSSGPQFLEPRRRLMWEQDGDDGVLLG